MQTQVARDGLAGSVSSAGRQVLHEVRQVQAGLVIVSAYYNEIDPRAAAWLRELIKAGVIADGEVDTRDIRDVEPYDLIPFTQCHFFAGIGVWSYALRLAGWSDDRPVWTGSCPCQPFSAAGKGGGFDDERHLWPAWFHLWCECRPVRVFGEQVAGKNADPWIDLVQSDVEALDYAFGAVPFPAAGIGTPHIRDRLYWVADANGGHASAEWEQRGGQHGQQPQDGSAVQLAYTDEHGRGARTLAEFYDFKRYPESRSSARELGNADDTGSQVGSLSDDGGRVIRQEGSAFGEAEPVRGFWSGADWIACRDGKYRPVEPGTFPLAHGAPARVGRLRGYGNAIVSEAAAEFIRAYMSRE